jgi:tripartite-type tricarboxylate transporter receptor subunit TctC
MSLVRSTFAQSVNRRKLLTALTAAGAGGWLPASSPAQSTTEFPAKPVRIITPFPVGSGPEGVVRLAAERLTKVWGKPVVVENRPGGNGFIAIDAFKKGATDGTDLLHLDNVHLTAYPHLFKRLPYDPQRDFEVLLPLFKAYFFFAVGMQSKYRNVADLIADAKAQPGKLNYGSWSVGNPVHLGSALFETMTGTDMQHVVYRETSQLYSAVANGELAFAMGSNATAGALQRAGKIRFMAVAGPRRIAAFPDVPTLAESGGPSGFEISAWTAIAAPKGLAPPIADKIQRDFSQVLADADVQEKFKTFGYEAFTPTRDQFGQSIAAESTRMAGIIRKTQASLD